MKKLILPIISILIVGLIIFNLLSTPKGIDGYIVLPTDEDSSFYYSKNIGNNSYLNYVYIEEDNVEDIGPFIQYIHNGKLLSQAKIPKWLVQEVDDLGNRIYFDQDMYDIEKLNHISENTTNLEHVHWLMYTWDIDYHLYKGDIYFYTEYGGYQLGCDERLRVLFKQPDEYGENPITLYSNDIILDNHRTIATKFIEDKLYVLLETAEIITIPLDNPQQYTRVMLSDKGNDLNFDANIHHTFKANNDFNGLISLDVKSDQYILTSINTNIKYYYDLQGEFIKKDYK